MKYVEVLCEGSSDVPALQEILKRRFKKVEDEQFRVHAHRGKGKLPSQTHLLKAPPLADQSLLAQLPIKLKNMGRQTQGDFEVVVLVVVDADDDDPRALLKSLDDMLAALPTRPTCCVFAIAVEETESWFIADPPAVKAAYPEAKVVDLKRIKKDAICGAWEALARALGLDPAHCSGREKTEWATAIAPHLDLLKPASPSLGACSTSFSKRSPESPMCGVERGLRLAPDRAYRANEDARGPHPDAVKSSPPAHSARMARREEEQP